MTATRAPIKTPKANIRVRRKASKTKAANGRTLKPKIENKRVSSGAPPGKSEQIPRMPKKKKNPNPNMAWPAGRDRNGFGG